MYRRMQKVRHDGSLGCQTGVINVEFARANLDATVMSSDMLRARLAISKAPGASPIQCHNFNRCPATQSIVHMLEGWSEKEGLGRLARRTGPTRAGRSGRHRPYHYLQAVK